MDKPLTEIYNAMSERQQAAFSALAFLRVLLDWDALQARHVDSARSIVKRADDADKALAE